MLICEISPLYFVILPIIFVQYIAATFALVRLARAQFKTAKYVLWNVFIMLGIFVGPITFFIYDAVRKKKGGSVEVTTEPPQEEAEETSDSETDAPDKTE